MYSLAAIDNNVNGNKVFTIAPRFFLVVTFAASQCAVNRDVTHMRESRYRSLGDFPYFSKFP